MIRTYIFLPSSIKEQFKPRVFQSWIFFYAVAFRDVDTVGSGPVINGTPIGGTGTGSWNITEWEYRNTGVDISHNQSLLSFTSQVATHLSIELEGEGNVIVANGTNHIYYIGAEFYFQGNSTTFFVTSPSVGTWLGYGVSLFVVIASVYLLVHKPKPKHTVEEAGTPV